MPSRDSRSRRSVHHPRSRPAADAQAVRCDAIVALTRTTLRNRRRVPGQDVHPRRRRRRAQARLSATGEHGASRAARPGPALLSRQASGRLLATSLLSADCGARSAAARRLVEQTRVRCQSLAVIRPTFYTGQRGAVAGHLRGSGSVTSMAAIGHGWQPAREVRAGQRWSYAVQLRYRRSGAARKVASANGRRTPCSSSSSPAAISRSAAACSASVAGALLARPGEGAVQHRGSGEVERLADVPQAAGDPAVVDEPRSWSERVDMVSNSRPHADAARPLTARGRAVGSDRQGERR